jgi:hypothetical protein
MCDFFGFQHTIKFIITKFHGKKKAKAELSLSTLYRRKREAEVQLQWRRTSALDGDVVTFPLWPLYPQERTSVLPEQDAQWAPQQVWTFRKNLLPLQVFEPPTFQVAARSKSWYALRLSRNSVVTEAGNWLLKSLLSDLNPHPQSVQYNSHLRSQFVVFVLTLSKSKTIPAAS